MRTFFAQEIVFISGVIFLALLIAGNAYLGSNQGAAAAAAPTTSSAIRITDTTPQQASSSPIQIETMAPKSITHEQEYDGD